MTAVRVTVVRVTVVRVNMHVRQARPANPDG